jgi:myo-inositol-1(or 4)-monophosphatase
LPEADLPLLEEAARAAGALALAHLGRAEAREKPGGHGPVTEADLAVDRMLRAELTAARPGYGWLSEESEDGPARLAAERIFIVDPIDGTRAFVAGRRAWAHALAVAEHGRVVAAVVHLPMLGRTYAAALGGGARLNGAPIAASAREALEGAQVLASGNQMDPGLWPGGVPQIQRHFRPSIAYRLCLAAEGRFDAMFTFRDTWEWDVAAGDLIAREAGAVVTTRHGHPPAYNRPAPILPGVIAAAPALHAAILARIPAVST